MLNAALTMNGATVRAWRTAAPKPGSYRRAAVSANATAWAYIARSLRNVGGVAVVLEELQRGSSVYFIVAGGDHFADN